MTTVRTKTDCVLGVKVEPSIEVLGRVVSTSTKRVDFDEALYRQLVRGSVLTVSALVLRPQRLYAVVRC